MSVKRQLFVSCNARGLELGAEQIGFGLPLILGFSLLPQYSHATALPTRYNIDKGIKSARWQGRQAAWLDKEALSLSPVFQLSRHCTNGVAGVSTPAAATAPPNALQHVRPITSHPIHLHPSQPIRGSSGNSESTTSRAAAKVSYPSAATTGSYPSGTAAAESAAATVTEQARHQLERQCTAAADDSQLPWLGAELDIAGYTKKGFMRGGGKEQNQDRGLIMQQFRSCQELLVGVMDGHGTFGHLVSTYVVQHLPAVLMQNLVAAAAVHNCSRDDSSSSEVHSRGRRQTTQGSIAPRHPTQHQLQYVVVPDHSSSSINSSSLATDLHEQQQQEKPGKEGGAVHRRGRVVSRHKVIHQPEHLQLDSSSSDSSSSGSVQGADTVVPCRLVNQVPLSKGLVQAVFAETDYMLNCSGINVMDSGSTALITHIGPDTLTTAWVGDSRAVLGRRVVDTDRNLKAQTQQQWQQWNAGGGSSSSSQKWQVIQLSDDHKPERPDEQLRIVMNNGRVAQMQTAAGRGVGPYRVWFKQLDYPGLAMSRAFGDAPCRRIGVTVEPQLYVHRLTADDQVMVAASDGVWEYLSNEEAVELVGGCESASSAARKLVEAAEQRWQQMERGNYIDDITAVVVRATHRRKQTSSRL